MTILRNILMFTHVFAAPEEQEIIDNMKKLMSKIDEMQAQRESLEQQLRDQVHNDDITVSLVTQAGDREVYQASYYTCYILINLMNVLCPVLQGSKGFRATWSSHFC